MRMKRAYGQRYRRVYYTFIRTYMCNDSSICLRPKACRGSLPVALVGCDDTEGAAQQNQFQLEVLLHFFCYMILSESSLSFRYMARVTLWEHIIGHQYSATSLQ
jgi:hypothetical protein